jgi:outer membrane receptor protein involved in Fe transport
MRDLIVPHIQSDDLNTLSAGEGKVTQKNAHEAWSWGVELSAEWQALQWLNVWGNYVFQQSRNETASSIRKLFHDAGRLPEGEDWRVPLDYVPRSMAHMGLRIRKEWDAVALEGSLSESFVGERAFQEFAGLKPEERPEQQFWLVNAGKPGETDLRVRYLNPPLVTFAPYWRTDVAVRMHIHERYTVALAIQNLTDAVFEESMGTEAPGRFATIEVGYRF